jgi:GH43 family beta-xylosidase
LEEIEMKFYCNPSGVTGIGDPYVLKAPDRRYYLYATSGGSGYTVWSSDDLYNWKKEGPAYTIGPKSWGIKQYWAPEVIECGGKYYMYYSALWPKGKGLRIGVAVSDDPKGPFVDSIDKPMFDLGYSVIDANILIDGGEKYLFYSRDCSQNTINGRHESHIYGVELGEDMISVKGEHVLLAKPGQEWEKASGPKWLWNEGPYVLKNNGVYYLMYSANHYAKRAYSIGYATSNNPLGPYEKYENNPIVTSVGNKISGPGHNSVTSSPDGKELFIVYHTHTDPKAGGGARQSNIDRMGFREDGTIFVNGPTMTKQPAPSGLLEYKNIAGQATVEVSSEKPGYSKDRLADGEFTIYEKNEKFEWASDAADKMPWVKLEWDEKKVIGSVLVYKSAIEKRNLRTGRLVFSNGNVITDIAIPETPGEAAIISFEEVNAKWIKFIPGIPNDYNGEWGLSEIMVFAKDKG